MREERKEAYVIKNVLVYGIGNGGKMKESLIEKKGMNRIGSWGEVV